jgi:hypothetical protein
MLRKSYLFIADMSKCFVPQRGYLQLLFINGSTYSVNNLHNAIMLQIGSPADGYLSA